MKGLRVWLDRIALRLPALQTTMKKFDSREVQGERLAQDSPAGLFAGTGAVDDYVPVLRDDRGVFNHFFGCDAFCARNDFRIDQEIERQAHIEDNGLLLRCQ